MFESSRQSMQKRGALPRRLLQSQRVRLLEEARRFRLDMERKVWCDLWHEHADWEGEGNQSTHIHREYLKALFIMFRRAHLELRSFPRPYQLFLAVYPKDSGSDAVYVHTENPNSDFPCDIGGVKQLDTVPWLLRGLVDLSHHQLMSNDDSSAPCFLVTYK